MLYSSAGCTSCAVCHLFAVHLFYGFTRRFYVRTTVQQYISISSNGNAAESRYSRLDSKAARFPQQSTFCQVSTAIGSEASGNRKHTGTWHANLEAWQRAVQPLGVKSTERDGRRGLPFKESYTQAARDSSISLYSCEHVSITTRSEEEVPHSRGG